MNPDLNKALANAVDDVTRFLSGEYQGNRVLERMAV